MRDIVVYKIIIALGFLSWAFTLAAQKPAIDLISSHQQYRHPAAFIDTGFATKPLVRETTFLKDSAAQEQELKADATKKERRQIGPSLDSIFHKERRGEQKKQKVSTKISLFDRKINPIKIFIFITALKY